MHLLLEQQRHRVDIRYPSILNTVYHVPDSNPRVTHPTRKRATLANHVAGIR